MSITQTAASSPVTLRVPDIRDAREIVRLVRESQVLDRNSDYAYLLLCQHFSETCVIAEIAGRAVGFAAAYRPPDRPDTIFVWQIAVSEEARGQGLAMRLLRTLVDRGAKQSVCFLEATVTPSNTASRALFTSFARRSDAACAITPCFTSDMFFGAGHEGEDLFRIGPIHKAHDEALEPP